MKIREATLEDARFLGENLRKPDILECCSHGMHPMDAVLMSFRNSDICRVAVVDNVPLAIFGVCTDVSDPSTGIVYLLGTKAIEKHAKSFLELSKKELLSIGSKYTKLTNLIHKINIKHLKWVQWLGFEITPYNFMFDRITLHLEKI